MRPRLRRLGGAGVTGQLLKAEQLAERWQVPVSQIWRLARTDAIPTVRLGRYVRFNPAAIEAFEAGETDRKQAA